MKKLLAAFLLLAVIESSYSQNVGIDVPKPQKKLSVNGSIVVDYDNNNIGTPDSAGLLFGLNAAPIGISSSRNGFQPDYMGLNMWTNGQKRFTILQNGNVGIGNNNPIYTLSVNGSLHTEGYAVINTNARINDNLGVGGTWSASHKLVVHGSSLFEERVAIGANGGGSERLYVQANGAGYTAARFAGGDVDIEQSLDVQHNASVANNMTVGNNFFLNGNAFFGGGIDNTYRLRVYGDARVDNNFRVGGRLAAGGAVDNTYQFRVYGNARIDDNFRVQNNMAVGGAVDENLRFRIWDGNSRFGGDVEITGTLNANNLSIASLNVNDLSIGGNGSVKSNGQSNLKIHFTEVFVDDDFSDAGQLSVFWVNLPDFEDADDVRLHISHFVPLVPVGANPHKVTTSFQEMDPVNNRCVLVLRSLTGDDFIIGGTYYIMVVMKDN